MIGIPGFTPHNLRNTYATLLHAEGEDPKKIQKAMRHKHLKTTLMYITFGKGDVREGADKIGEAAGLSHKTDTNSD
jgi:integrase